MSKCNDIVANRDIPSPTNYGWTEDTDEFSSIMTTIDPTPEFILQLVKCACTETTRCRMQKVTSYNIPSYVVVELRMNCVQVL